MNVGSGTFQLLSTVGGLALAGLAYNLWQKNKQNVTPPLGNNGLDPNFPGGKPIKPSGPIDPNDFKLPSCQTWNHQQNLFENAGHPEWDSDVTGQTCFSEASYNGSIVRYVDPNGKISYNTENPLNAPDDEKGKCYFWDGKTLSAFPNYGGYTPPNRSARLCFDSGATQAEAGIFFRRDNDGVQIWNPNVSWFPFSQQVFPAGAYGDTASLVDAGTDHCEVYRGFPSNNPAVGSTSMVAYAASSDSTAVGKDLSACLKLQNARYWQPSQNRIVYKNPNNDQMVETPLMPLGL